MRGYYIHFSDADTKIVYTSEGFMEVPIVIKREDFYIEGNVKIQIESSAETEQRKNRQRLAFNETIPFILQDQSVPAISKRRALLRVWEINGIEMNQIMEELPKLPDEVLQEQENILLAKWIQVDINADDDDLVHLVAVEAVTHTMEGELHKQAHLLAYIQKGKPQPMAQDPGLANQMASQSMSQTGSQSAKANSQPMLTAPV